MRPSLAHGCGKPNTMRSCVEPEAMPPPSYERYDKIVDRLTKGAEKSGAENVAVEPSGVEEAVVGAVSKAASPAGPDRAAMRWSR